MKENNNMESSNTISSADLRIRAILNTMQPTGSLDSEKESIDEILNKLHSGSLTPEEAILKAESIESRRQDYH